MLFFFVFCGSFCSSVYYHQIIKDQHIFFLTFSFVPYVPSTNKTERSPTLHEHRVICSMCSITWLEWFSYVHFHPLLCYSATYIHWSISICRGHCCAVNHREALHFFEVRSIRCTLRTEMKTLCHYTFSQFSAAQWRYVCRTECQNAFVYVLLQLEIFFYTKYNNSGQAGIGITAWPNDKMHFLNQIWNDWIHYLLLLQTSGPFLLAVKWQGQNMPRKMQVSVGVFHGTECCTWPLIHKLKTAPL